MTKSTITRERLQEIADDGFLKHGESKVLARMALAAMDSEPVAIVEPSDYVTAAQLVGEGPVRKAVHELYEGALRIGDKLYRHAQPAQTGVDDDVRNIIGLLETNEWAEHCTETVLGSRLEAEITRLVGSAQTAPVVPDKMNYQDGVLFVLNNDMSSIERGTVAMRAWNACRAAMLQGADGKPELTVWYGAMPETNGKTNWTAILHREGQHPWEGITIDRSEYPDRVRYEADRMRHLIGELADEPDILAYDAEAHSGYVYPGNSPVIPDGYVMVPKEPTERMVINGFESEPDETFSEPEVWEAFQKMSGCEQAAFRARLCWAAMLAAAPQEVKGE